MTNSIILTLATLSYIISTILWHKIHAQIKSLKKMSAWWGFWWILLKNVFSLWSTLCIICPSHTLSLDFKPTPTLQMLLRSLLTSLFLALVFIRSATRVKDLAITLSPLFLSPPTSSLSANFVNSNLTISLEAGCCSPPPPLLPPSSRLQLDCSPSTFDVLFHLSPIPWPPQYSP